MRRALALLVALGLITAACTRTTSPTTTAAPGTTTTAAEPAVPLYLMLMWHQHQPFYPKDDDGVYTRPWVRVHATKDYYDMAAMVARYPGLAVTFNLTPVLLLQLEDLAGGAKDVYWVKAEIPAAELSDEDRRFILERFFDVNPRIVARFPRFQELADARAALTIDGALNAWSEQDFRDLQVLFNLAWTDPDFLAEEPLAALVAQGEGFAEEDKQVLFAEHLRIIRETIPLHARLWEEGVIEVTTTPYAHPILPLVSDTDLAAVGDPAALLPDNRFREIADADQHIVRGLDTAQRLLGRRPVGMWPGEGSVAQLVMGLFSKNGVEWVATGEDVLARSLAVGSFTRDAAGTVERGDLLYRPWAAVPNRPPNVAMFFRDVRLSDLIGFEYSGRSGPAGADDFMQRLRAIRDSLDLAAAAAVGQPYVVSVILDGENAWEHYPNDGKDFLDALYRALGEADWVETITPAQYLEQFAAPETLGEVFPASWFQPNYATWIGEEEEAFAWDYLFRVRQHLRRAEQSGDYDPDALAAAYEKMLFAEGSDWFWWYGADQDSGDDGYFDRAYRELLGQVYDALGDERPQFVGVPIIPERPVAADVTPGDLLTVAMDGDGGDWEGGGTYRFAEGPVAALWWAFDKENFYLRVDGPPELTVYLGAPQGKKTALTRGGTPLGFGATGMLLWDGGSALLCPAGLEVVEPTQCPRVPAAALAGGFEAAVPLGDLGALEAGDALLAKVEAGSALLPAAGPALAQVPDISNVLVLLSVADPTGDDHGPGGYTYPLDAVFVPGSYDLASFEVGTEGEDVVFTFEVAARIQNPWGSPRGLSVQTFDVYVDTDPGAGSGARVLIPGRNAALEEGNGWEYAVTVEGWDPAIYRAAADGTWEETKPSFDVVTFGDKGKVVVRIPATLLGGGDPAAWGYAAVVLSQEGFPSAGVRRVRDVLAAAQQWRLGGGPNDVNHTRIIDVAWPVAAEQESLLSGYRPAASGTVDDLAPDDLPQVPLNVPGA